jgi:hypothetical protein
MAGTEVIQWDYDKALAKEIMSEQEIKDLT